MANSEQSTVNTNWITESVLIASAPVVAYVLALSYIAGYAGYFDIPTDFISLSVGTLFSVGGHIVSIGLLLFGLFVGFFVWWPHSDSPILWRVKAVSPWAALLLIQLAFFGKRWQEWIANLFLFAVLIAHFFLIPRIGRDQLTTYSQKLRDCDLRKWGSHPTVTDYFFRSSLGGRIITVMFWTWFSLTVSYNGGRFDAMWHQNFLVPASSPDNVVLSSFGESMIVAPFDRKTKEVERSFLILRKGEDPKLLLRWELIGPLKLKNQPTPASKPNAP